MPRIETVQKARKDQGKCGKCGTPILAGDAYRHTTLKTGQRSSQRKVRCMKDGCSFRQSDLTISRRGEAYAVQEGLEDDVAYLREQAGVLVGGTSPANMNAVAEGRPVTDEEWLTDLNAIYESANDALGTAADALESVYEDYRESASNIEDGFGHETQQSQELNETADEIEAWAEEVREALNNSGIQSPEEVLESESDLEEWLESIIETVEEASTGCPV